MTLFDLQVTAPTPTDARVAGTNQRESDINRSSFKQPRMLRGLHKSMYSAYVTTNVAFTQPGELVTDLSRVTSGICFSITDTVFVPIVMTPKVGAPGTAVITGLASSKTYLLVVFGDK